MSGTERTTQPRAAAGAYDPSTLEPRWQRWWEERGVFRAPNPGEPGFDAARPKFYVLDMFPYPSGAGLHVGHPEGYTATDIVARYKRMRGCNVLHPMGWDAFGLPAEQYAIATGVHPAITTRKAIDTFRRQLKRFGFAYDWSRELATFDPDYYRWTQWIFLKIYDAWFDPQRRQARPISELVREFEAGARAPRINPDAAEHTPAEKAQGFAPWADLDDAARHRIISSYRLAYLAEQTVNWCPRLGTALANEEVTADGLSERGHFPVFRKPLRQWMFRITAYAQRLLEELAQVDWPESTLIQQSEWIGRSEGAEIDFPLAPSDTQRCTESRTEGGTEGGTDLRDVPLVAQTSAMAPLASTGPRAAPRAFHRPPTGFEATVAFCANPVGFEGRDPFPKGQPCPTDLQVYQRTLPHLQLDGATYFVTWCSHPGFVLSPADRDLAMAALLHWDDKSWRVYAACVMPDHVHAIVRPFTNGTLLKLLESVKRFSATRINQQHARMGNVWQDENLDHIIRDGDWFSRFLHYLAMNPVEAGLCSSAAEYPWTLIHDDVQLPSTSADRPLERHSAGAEQSSQAGALGGTSRRSVPPADSAAALRVFTTRPDTIFGATYMVVAPEHPLVGAVLEDPAPETDAGALRAYVEAARKRGDVERMAGAEKQKTGVFTGLYCINPATQTRIPIWTADYVLMGYGTGAIMAVPGQDQRDWDFARAFALPIIRTVQPPDGFDGEAYLGDGPAINSAFLNGLGIDQSKRRIIDWLEENGVGARRINYKLRDWLFSRQRYWGEPFPLAFDEHGRHHAVDAAHLPVVLPEMADYHPQESDEPRPLLAKAASWVHTTAEQAGIRGLPPDARVRRETNTMPGWAGSCWYYLRYCDPKNHRQFVGDSAQQYWMGKEGVDLYIGGSEHAVLHLLYARFWHKVLYDLGLVTSDEPFRKLFHQGLITSFAYQRPDRSLVPTDQVEEPEEGRFVEKATGRPVTQIVAKMSKSLKNVVNPDDVIGQYGADTFRLYEMFMGPLEASKPWNTRDVGGLYKLCNRIWRLFVDTDTGALHPAVTTDEPTREQLRILHKTVKHVTQDIENLKFNTAIARLFDFVNAATPMERRPVALLEPFLRVLSPFAPHLAEELRERLWQAGLLASPGAVRPTAEQADRPSGATGAADPSAYVSVTLASWPEYDEALARDDEVEIAVQIMGKVKAKIVVPADADEAALEQAALADARVQEQLAGKTVRKVIAVKGRLVNIVAG